MMADTTGLRSLLTNVCVLLVIGSSFSSGGDASQTPSRNVMCYYHFAGAFQNWDGVTLFNVSDIDFSICTHLVSYFATMSYQELTIQPYELMEPVWERIQELKPSNPSLKVILTVKGMHVLLRFTAYKDKQTVINKVITFLRKWNFDGIDLFWGKGGITPNTTTFIEEMKAAFNSEATSSGQNPLILMMTVTGQSGYMFEGVNLQTIARAVDIFHVITAEYGNWQHNVEETALNAPLYGNGTIRLTSVSESVNYYLEAGMIPEKLHMAVQLFARTYTLSDPQLTGVGAPADAFGEMGEYFPDRGIIPYYEVCKRLNEDGYTAEVDPEGLVNFAYKGDQWMTYEDPASIDKKIDYVNEHNLGGVVAWYISLDDYTGEFCNEGRYPLLSDLSKLAFQGTTAATTLQPQRPPPCPDDWIQYENSCYVLVSHKMTWFGAKSLCNDRNAFLVTAETREENIVLKSLAQTAGGSVWIGGYDIFSEGDWRWAQGYQPFTFTDWGKDQPNNSQGTQHCLGYDSSLNFTWNDFVCEEKQAFICEIGESTV